jgi:glycogen debranching enzyme
MTATGHWSEAFSDVLKVDDRFYILATSSLADDRPRVLKQDETFAVFDHQGDVRPVGLEEEGVYHEGTRYLSSWLLRLGENRPLFLGSTVREDRALLTADLTNADWVDAAGTTLPRGSVHILRTRLLWRGSCYERLRLKSYCQTPARLDLNIHFAADFADVFEVRGVVRPRRGSRLATEVTADGVVLGYRGLDGGVRRSRIRFAPRPARLDESGAGFELALGPGEEALVYAIVSCEPPGGVPAPAVGYEEALEAAGRHRQALSGRICRLRASNELFEDWLDRSLSDLDMMLSDTGEGFYPYAGVPWFSTVFGRDGLITAYECLWTDPEMARGVLTYLAANQAAESVPEQDAEPGKILHETRKGEMAALGEIPFGRYYGSVDSTPLFVLVAGAYYRRTGDLELARALWPAVERALGWIDEHGDLDGDGFVEYRRRTPEGLVNQGWKDSQDSVVHADGELAEGPIALCEVQAYVYAARRGAAELAEALGEGDRAAELRRQAEALRERFEEAFWCDDLGTYALALDGDKRPCRVRTSNAGHCLLAGIASPERARRTADTLLDPRSFSGWGVRTLAAGEARYNPMSYHDGSIWPHDNALVAAGLARYGFKRETLAILDGLFDASILLDLHRMPELFCGFDRRPDCGPTLYPLACAPQSWAAAAVFLLLQAALGLEIDAPGRRLRLCRPLLPATLPELEIRNLRIADATLDLRLRRRKGDVTVDLLARQGEVEVQIVK